MNTYSAQTKVMIDRYSRGVLAPYGKVELAAAIIKETTDWMRMALPDLVGEMMDRGFVNDSGFYVHEVDFDEIMDEDARREEELASRSYDPSLYDVAPF